ncbi:MAG: hypothetical protein Q9172_005627 [Xanthocarpia lactea]
MSELPNDACDINQRRSHPTDIVANPDIAGIGVFIGFLTTAYMTLCIVVAYYLMGCIESRFLNIIDTVVLNKLSPRKYVVSVQRLETTLRRIVLMFSDQQAVTGIALLASGYAQLKSGIDSYHWQIVVYLAWFSSLTHLTTLTVLRQYFRENHHARSWRAVVMFITVVMLGAALLPTGVNQWFSGPFDPAASIPAICYFRRLTSATYTERFELGSVSTLSMVISLFVLASGYLTRIIKLSERATIFSQTWLMEKPSGSLRSTRDSSLQRIEKHVPGLQKICWIALLWLASALAWGTRNLVVARFFSRIHGETTWEFGQMFPVLLLMIPIISVVETYNEKETSSHQHSPLQNIHPGNNTGGSLKLIHVGQWKLKPKPPSSGSSIPLGTARAISRTGTDLQTEEQAMGIAHSRTMPHLTGESIGSGSGSSPSEQTPSIPSYDYYEFEWFWILVLTILLSALAAIIFVLVVASQIVRAYFLILTAAFWYSSLSALISVHQRSTRQSRVFSLLANGM